jgi:hypothetical protein
MRQSIKRKQPLVFFFQRNFRQQNFGEDLFTLAQKNQMRNASNFVYLCVKHVKNGNRFQQSAVALLCRRRKQVARESQNIA